MNHEKVYKQILLEWNHDKYCTMPGKGSVLYFALIYLYINKNKIVNKKDVLLFLKENKIKTNDLQIRQLRHQHFLDVDGKDVVGNGNYRLNGVRPHPSKILEKRRCEVDNFEEIKKLHNNSCATCGCKEGKEHKDFPNQVVKLEKGHMNPSLPLIRGNIIPQCQICNKTYQDNFVFSERGFIEGIYNPSIIKRSIEKGFITKEQVLSIFA